MKKKNSGIIPYTPWNEALRLRREISDPGFAASQFAMDLYDALLRREESPIGSDPKRFFTETVATSSLLELAKNVLARLAGQGGDRAVYLLSETYGGGKTHSEIALLHLARDPNRVPDAGGGKRLRENVKPYLTALSEGVRIAALPCHQLDAVAGIEFPGPEGKSRSLKRLWSALAYQIAGDEGLRVLQGGASADERDDPPSGPTLEKLLRLPGKPVLILIDEALSLSLKTLDVQGEPAARTLQEFYQSLTETVAETPRCALVASLLTSDKNLLRQGHDGATPRVINGLNNVFSRVAEAPIAPISRDEVAVVLRTRFFEPRDSSDYPTYVDAALAGIERLDPSATPQQKTARHERFVASYPFHPDVTEVLFEKWTQLTNFQMARGVLRLFAFALREAEKRTDEGPLVGVNVFLPPGSPDHRGQALSELAGVAELQQYDGEQHFWPGILQGELEKAQAVQADFPALTGREIEQAVVGTFLFSQPLGQSAERDQLYRLVAPTSPDKIVLNQALSRWVEKSWFLDEDEIKRTDGGEVPLPMRWRLGNLPNLNRMHAAAVANLQPADWDTRLKAEQGTTDVKRYLETDIRPAKAVPYLFPDTPGGVPDSTNFAIVVLDARAVSRPGEPSRRAAAFLNQTTSEDRPRLRRNALIVVTPSPEGLDEAREAARILLGWEAVERELQQQKNKAAGNSITGIEQRIAKVASSIREARNTLAAKTKAMFQMAVTVGADGKVEVHRIAAADVTNPAAASSLLNRLRQDKKLRFEKTPGAESLLPNGPYEGLWRADQACVRARFFIEKFTEDPAFPKLLHPEGLVDVLAEACRLGLLALRFPVADKTFVLWKQSPQPGDLTAASLEACLPASVTLTEMGSDHFLPEEIPALWKNRNAVPVSEVLAFYVGDKRMEIHGPGFDYAIKTRVPAAAPATVRAGIAALVKAGKLWLTDGDASLYREEVIPETITESALVRTPPSAVSHLDIVSEKLPEAWTEDGAGKTATPQSIQNALSARLGYVVPHLLVRDAINRAISQLLVEGNALPEYWAIARVQVLRKPGGAPAPAGPTAAPMGRVARATLKPNQIQDLADIVGSLNALGMKHGLTLELTVTLSPEAPQETVDAINALLLDVSDNLRIP